MAHIHLGPPGISGAVLFTLFDYRMPSPSPSLTSQTVSGVLTSYDFQPDTYDGVNTFAQAITDLQNGYTYANLHTASPEGTYPDYRLGEIRGQITDPTAATAAPGPASVALVAASSLLVALCIFPDTGHVAGVCFAAPEQKLTRRS